MKNTNLGFFQGGKSIVFVKSLRFLQLCFSCKIDQEKVSGDVLLTEKVFCNRLQTPITRCDPL